MNKPMSDKQFIRKASSRISADAFLDAYEAHIRETYPESVETVNQYRSGQMNPTQALDFVKEVAKQHMLAMMVTRAEESIRKSQTNKTEKAKSGIIGTGNCTCQLFVKETCERTGEFKIVLWVDHNGNHTFRAASYQDALRLVDRKQVDLSTSQYATIVMDVGGKPMTTRVERLDSMARFFKSRPGPVCKVRPQSAPLKQKMSVHNYVASFSRG